MAAAATTEDEGPALAGGVWPWLLGGSMIAGLAVISLSYPRGRRTTAADSRRRRGMRANRPPGEGGDGADDAHDADDLGEVGVVGPEGDADAGDPERPREWVR